LPFRKLNSILSWVLWAVAVAMGRNAPKQADAAELSGSDVSRIASARRNRDLCRATRPRRNREAEAVQFDDGSDQAQTQAQSLGIAAFIGARGPHSRGIDLQGLRAALPADPDDNDGSCSAACRRCWGTGAGSELRQPLGYTIVGGLLVS
jgi:hypothetical protein